MVLLKLHDAVVAIERPDDEGDGSGDSVVREQFVDCVIKLDVSKDFVIIMGSVLILLLLPSDMVIDILRPGVFVSYIIVVLFVYSSKDDTPSGDTL